jgi:hypothetical protein
VVPFHLNGTVAHSLREGGDTSNPQDQPAVVQVSFEWTAGKDLFCPVAAMALRVVDIVAMTLIPTQNIAHQRELQEECEILYGEAVENANDLDQLNSEAVGSVSEINREVNVPSRPSNKGLPRKAVMHELGVDFSGEVLDIEVF